MIPVERVERTILLIRGQKVVIDADLAALYGIPTRATPLTFKLFAV